MNSNEKKQIQAMRANHAHLENHRKKWSPAENSRLCKMYRDGDGLTEMALKLGRKEESLPPKLRKMGLLPKINKRRGL